MQRTKQLSFRKTQMNTGLMLHLHTAKLMCTIFGGKFVWRAQSTEIISMRNKTTRECDKLYKYIIMMNIALLKWRAACELLCILMAREFVILKLLSMDCGLMARHFDSWTEYKCNRNVSGINNFLMDLLHLTQRCFGKSIPIQSNQ